ncbi:MAG: SURF1 family protein [Acidimicrobiales bacterium]
MERYRFALKPKWILSHLFVLFMVVAMINLGLWQLRRLDEKRQRNARIEQRMADQTVDLEGSAEPGDFAATDALQWRVGKASGTYVADQQVLVRSRSLDGAPGSWVITPLRLDDGTELLVNRGWIQNNGQFDRVPKRYAPPTGEVQVTGLVRGTETRGRFGPKDPTTGTLANLARADVARLDQQIPQDVLPFWLQLLEQDPAVSAKAPQPVPVPALDEGPHLSYALQWFTFTALVLIFYPLILRRRAREIEKEQLDAEAIAAAEAGIGVPSPDEIGGQAEAYLRTRAGSAEVGGDEVDAGGAASADDPSGPSA